MISTDFSSLTEVFNTFPDEQTCIQYLEKIRWNGKVVSPFDATSKVYKCNGNKYKCKNSGKYFNARTGTIFDNTKIALLKWFAAFYLVNAGKDISSVQMANELHITQKTAWIMLQRIANI